MNDHLEHIGTKRHSGRYPWGSGENPFQRTSGFLIKVDQIRSEIPGISTKDLAKAMGYDNSSEFVRRRSIEVNKERKRKIEASRILTEEGKTPSEIGKEYGIGESSVRSYLKAKQSLDSNKLESTTNALKTRMDEVDLLDVGRGVSELLNVSPDKLKTATQSLEDQGYNVYQIPVTVGKGRQLNVRVLAKPGITFEEAKRRRGDIQTIEKFSEDGVQIKTLPKPKPVDSKRVGIRYGDEGGSDRDGLVEIRPGVPDLSLGSSRYAQVRIAVDGTHYIKGMAVYSKDLPAGIDILVNSNKKNTGNKLDALKVLENDEDRPFKSVVRAPDFYIDSKGKRQQSSINKIREEGDWTDWSIKFSSQMLSKQNPKLINQQLSLTKAQRKADYDEIMSLTNSVVRKKMLGDYADKLDSAAVHLKAAALPRTKNHVILPITGMKENEIFAPGYRNGERVVLIRYPHAGIFEIPELVVNNRSRKAREIMPSDARDAVGIHPNTAKKLSGADFDGDSVLVIPNNRKDVRYAPYLKELKNFDPKMYVDEKAKSAGRKTISSKYKQIQMGIVSNLITDMTIKGATESEISRAVKHSMVIIDSEKHYLDYRQSALDNNISQLRDKYQRNPTTGKSGSSTIISRSKSPVEVPEFKSRSFAKGGPIDPKTGRRVYEATGKRVYNRETGKRDKLRTVKVSRMSLSDDAYALVSDKNNPVERAYADYANYLKGLANQSRKSYLNTTPDKRNPQAAKRYSSEVSSLRAKLTRALQQAPASRRAEIAADAAVREIVKEDPALYGDQEAYKKVRYKELVKARLRYRVEGQDFDITDKEWEAIQNNAVSPSFLEQVLTYANADKVKKLAMPKNYAAMSPSRIALAKRMKDSGYSNEEVANKLGVSVTELDHALYPRKR